MMRIPPVAVVLVLAAFAAGSPARAAGAPPASFAIAVPAEAGAEGHWRTPALHAARAFELVGAEWRGAGAGVELRVRRASGRWSRWARVVAGEPVWSGRAVAVQLQGARPVRGLHVRAVTVGRAPAAARLPRAGEAAANGRPPIVPRSAWDPRNRCRPRVQARYGRVDFAVIHHTESLSAYSPGRSAALVLGICLFHRDGNEWNDLGYDYLVDRFGRVFEGRAGGVEQPVIGAHSGGWNTMSTGVAMIGSYTLATPPPAALGALERLLAWRLSLAGVPAQGSVAERSIGGEPGVNAHPRGSLVRFQRISGHRDADLTDCPGGALYALLPQIRRAVAARMPAARDLLTLGPVGAPIEQAPWLLTGRLALARGRRPAGFPVRVEQRGADGLWREVALTRTGVDGIWSATPTLLVNGPLRAISTLPDGRELVSGAADAQARARVRLLAARARLRPGGTLQLSGLTSPPKARVRVLAERRTSPHAWRPVAVLGVGSDATGRFAASVRMGGAGVYRVIASTRADALNAAGFSRTLRVRVSRRG